jgi:hypothetical protein
MLLLQVSEKGEDYCIQKIQKKDKDAYPTKALRVSASEVDRIDFTLGLGRRRESILWLPS